MSYDGDTPTDGELILSGAERAIEEISVAYPYAVVEQDAATGLVSLAPLIRVRGDDGDIADLPRLSEVPVSYPSGGGYHLVYPLSKGDEGLVIAASRSISQWVESGDAKADPEGRRISSLTDAVFFPGLRPRSNPRAELQTGAMSIGSDAGNKEVVVIGDPVRVGSPSAVDSVAKSAPVTVDLTKIAADFQQIIVIFTSLGKGFAPTFTSVSDNATSKLKAE